MDEPGSSFWEFVIPPLLSCLGIHNIYKAYVIGKKRNEIMLAPFISDDETIATYMKQGEGSYVGLKGKLISSDGSSSPVICTRHRVIEFDGLFNTPKRETETPVELGEVRVERSYGRSLLNLGRVQKEIIHVESPDEALGFDSLFMESGKTDISRRPNGINFLDILRFTEEAIYAGTTVTIFGQLDIDGSDIRISTPFNWTQPFVMSIRDRNDLVEELQDLVINYRRTAVYTFAGLLIFLFWKKMFNWTIKRFSDSNNRRNNSYDSVDFDSNAVCIVCLEHPREVLLVDCGHVAVCNDCARLLHQCPLCRASIDTNPCRIFIT